MYRKQIAQKASPSLQSTPKSQDILPSRSYGSLSAVVQRVQQDPNSVSEDERQQLESAIGTRSTREILAGKQTPWVPEFQGISQQLWGNSEPVVAPIQAKLIIGGVGDKYEQEADRVAKDVVQQIHAPQTNALQRKDSAQIQSDTLQRQQTEDEELQRKPLLEIVQRQEAAEGLDTAINSARGSGQPLEPSLQQSMEQAMRADFSGVRVHTNTQADQLNRSIQAKAFTIGRDIFFRQGAYEPGSRGGQELIAHELTHVQQQGGGEVRDHIKPQIIQRYFQLPAFDATQPTVPGYTAAVGAEFPSQEYVEGQARRTNKVVSSTGLDVYKEVADVNNQFQPQLGPHPQISLNAFSLNVSESGAMAIENTTAQARAFYADATTLTQSNQKLKDLASPVKLVASGGTIQVPTDPNPAHHDLTPKTLDQVTADSQIPIDHPSEGATKALLTATSTSECNQVIKMILGAAQSARKVVLGRAVDSSETQVEGREGSEPIYEIANFVGTTNIGSNNVGNLATATQTRVPYAQKSNVEINYNAVAATNTALGINEQALPDVGEGYVIRSLAGVTRPGGVSYATPHDANPVTADANDEYYDALQMLQTAGGNLNTIIQNMATNQERANRAMHLKVFWGEHYAGVIAKDGGDTMTYENYNRAPQWKWPINEAFNNLYLNVQEFRQYIRGLNQILKERNYSKQKQLIDDFATHVHNTSMVLTVGQQQMVDSAVNTVKGYIEGSSDFAKDMMYFQMYGQQLGQSFHEKFTTSPEPLAATANAMTLRVQTNLNQHRQAQKNQINPKIAAIHKALTIVTPDATLNATLKRLQNQFGEDTAQIFLDLAGATTVREVEIAVISLSDINKGIWNELDLELTRIDPNATLPVDKSQAAQYIQGLINNYHIGRGLWGRSERKDYKQTLRSLLQIIQQLPILV
ncbi:DUF4157 domain-containing protein [Calothrix sp. PCC 7507]|uniref:eCIS core domain-containing protein n=1 Tax=Calothrix sp. PCC 7507 TaxID=99598 RepID=UPI00029EF1FF|nr:DUF4157 domain-containing protein [Calothrix sp. PCC 7507]AFY33601.1 hypothetical protein Cal7507_3193 [Calothrix sp. PCC 7507]